MKKKKEEKGISKDKHYNNFLYQITTDEGSIVLGDYIFDFIYYNAGADPIIQCDTRFMVELVNKEHQKPIADRRFAKVVASNHPVLIVHGVPKL